MAVGKLTADSSTFTLTNSLVSTVMAASTTTLRYPGYMNNDLVGLVAVRSSSATHNSFLNLFQSLIPSPKRHFLVTGYTPFDATEKYTSRNATALDVMRRLLQTKNMLITSQSNDGLQGKFISVLNVIQGDVQPQQVHKALQRLKSRALTNFIDWAPVNMQVSSLYIISERCAQRSVRLPSQGVRRCIRKLEEYED